MARFKRAYPGPPRIHQGPSPAPAAPAGQLYRPRPFVARRQARAGAKAGPGSKLAAGLAAPPLPAAGAGLPQVFVSIVIGSGRRTRAWAGRCPVAGGVGGPPPAVLPPVVACRRPPQVRRLSPARVLWRGLAGPQPPAPVTTAYQKPAPRSRRSPGTRAWTGPGSTAGGVAAPPGPGVTPYLTGVITTHDTDGTVTTWNITGAPAS